MPNLVPPVTTSAMAQAIVTGFYLPCLKGLILTRLWSYLTEDTDPLMCALVQFGLVTSVKLYPAGATTTLPAVCAIWTR